MNSHTLEFLTFLSPCGIHFKQSIDGALVVETNLLAACRLEDDAESVKQ